MEVPKRKKEVLLLLLLLVAAHLPATTAYAELEICDKSGGCNLTHVDSSSPTKLCVRSQDLPDSWWAPLVQMRLRVVLGAASETSSGWLRVKVPAKFSADVTRAPRGICALDILPSFLCRDCGPGSKCAASIRQPWGVGDQVRDIYLPAGEGSCAYIKSLPEGVHRARAQWEQTVDWTVPLAVILGYILITHYASLRSYVPLHAFLGGSLAIIFVLCFVAVWFGQRMRKGIPGIPFSGVLSSMAMLTVSFSALAGQAFSHWFPSLSWMTGKAILEFRDPVWNLPIGWIGFIVAILVVVGAVSGGAHVSMRYFESPPEPEGDVPFEIGPDGRRIDLVPALPWPQWFLGGALWTGGLLLLINSSHVDLFNVSIIIFAVGINNTLHSIRQLGRRVQAVRPDYYRTLLSPEDYAAEGARRTNAALAALREHLQRHPGDMNRVDEKSELRIRRFSTGGNHFQEPLEQLDRGSSGWGCVIL